jgi:transposase-like protein
MTSFFTADPRAVNSFREKTDGITKNANFTKPFKICHKCKCNTLEPKKVKGTGTSRHNAARYLCPTCQ